MAELELLRRALKRERAAREEAESIIEDRARELYEAKMDAQLAMRVKTQMLANVSHELKTPLNVIIGFADLLAIQLENTLTSQQADFLREIRGAGRHLSDVYGQILDMSRLELNTTDLSMENLEVHDVLDNVYVMIHERAKAANVKVNISYPGRSELPGIYGNKAALTQAIVNVAGNAVKFSKPGGFIELKAVAGETDDIVISVVDYGIGMTKDEAKFAVLPFYQVDGGTTRNSEGVGLGLSIAKRLVELHEGSLKIKTNADEGTTVSMVLPVSKYAAEAVETFI